MEQASDWAKFAKLPLATKIQVVLQLVISAGFVALFFVDPKYPLLLLILAFTFAPGVIVVLMIIFNCTGSYGRLPPRKK